MARKTALIKLSGDLCHRDDVLEYVRKITKDYFVVICVGGGVQINQAFAEQGLPVEKYGPLGRATKSFKARQIARDVLERNQAKAQDLLAERGIPAIVIIPVLDIGTVLCHVNGDTFVLTVYNGYDKIIVVTLRERAGKKREFFAQYPKIEVIEFSAQP